MIVAVTVTVAAVAVVKWLKDAQVVFAGVGQLLHFLAESRDVFHLAVAANFLIAPLLRGLVGIFAVAVLSVFDVDFRLG